MLALPLTSSVLLGLVVPMHTLPFIKRCDEACVLKDEYVVLASFTAAMSTEFQM
jgi:hypothetical protein